MRMKDNKISTTAEKDLESIKKFIKYENKLTNETFLINCLYEINLCIIQAMIVKKKMEKKIVVLRLKRCVIWIATIIFILIFLRTAE